MSVLLVAVSLLVGTLIGAVGVGGVLLIPALDALTSLGIHRAMATALFTFLFTGLLGTALFQRRGSIDWRVAMPLCAGAVVSGFLGALVNARLDARLLTLILALLIICAGLYTVWTGHRTRAAAYHERPLARTVLLVGIGAFTGFCSGLTGVGGPALSVPVMMLFGFPPLVTIGASQVIQIVAAASGTVGNLRYGAVDFRLALVLTVLELIGVTLGVAIVHRISARALRRLAGGLCLAVGAGLIVRTFGFLG